METTVEPQNEDFETTHQLKITESSKNYLSETGKWVYFLAIVGFIMVGIFVVIALFSGAIFSNLSEETNPLPFSGVFISIIYLLLALVYFIPIYYLFNFANNIRKALDTKKTESMDKAFLNLKYHYKFMGILTIIMLSFYLVFGIGAMFLSAI